MNTTAHRNHREWMWVIRNLISAVAAIFLAGVLSQIEVFRHASLGSSGLSASQVVHVLGSGVALVLIWISARGARDEIPERSPSLRLLHHALLPLVTLLILPAAYGLIRPFVGERAEVVFSWLFVLPLIATAVWLGLVLHDNADGLVLAGEATTHRLLTTAKRATRGCRACGATSPVDSKFCGNCGAYLDETTGGAEPVETTAKQRSQTGATGPA